jgi:modulator of FtsH protease
MQPWPAGRRTTPMMLADIYHPDAWNSFFIMVGGGVAALTGLVFVALSIALSQNLADMTEDATHKYRSINTLAGLTGVFVTCGLVLMPDQNHKEIAAELLIVGLAGAAIFLYGFRQAFKFGSQPSKQRLVVGTALYGAQLIGALILLSGSISGLYVAAIAIVSNVAFMISAAWLLVVSVYSGRTHG